VFHANWADAMGEGKPGMVFKIGFQGVPIAFISRIFEQLPDIFGILNDLRLWLISKIF